MNLANKIVIITGAGSGIGAATAKLFGKHGAMVVASDINLENAQKIANEIKEAGGTASAVKTDVTKFEEVQSLISETVKEYKRLDVMVNNAGIGGKNQKKTAEHTHEDWHKVIAVNQTGVFLLYAGRLATNDKAGVWQYCQCGLLGWPKSFRKQSFL